MQTKTCIRCGAEKPIERFSITDKRRGYRKGACMDCEAARLKIYYRNNPEYREARRKQADQWRRDNPDRHREIAWGVSIKRKFGLTPAQYEAMFEAQDRCCALCCAPTHGRNGKSGRHDGSRNWRDAAWNVDHDHKTGRVRGLLCLKCNVRIGAYEGLRDEVGMDRVLAYLEG